MSDELFKQQLLNFLSDEHNDIITIKGAWGAGKTYAWNHYLKKAKEANDIHLKKYAYVSLYGLNSIEDLRRAIFESVIDTNLIGEKLALDSPLTNTIEHAASITRKYLRDAGVVTSAMSKLISAISQINIAPMVSLLTDSVTSAFVKETVICLDDLERRGESLRLSEIFGLANHLRESRGCRLALILNHEKLNDDNTYEVLSEKTIDRELLFNPSAEEAFEMAVDNLKTSLGDKFTFNTDKIKKTAYKLNIKNIRILIKILRNAEVLFKEIKDITLSDFTLDDIHKTLVVQSLSYYGHKIYPDVPPLEDYEQVGSTIISYVDAINGTDNLLNNFLTRADYSSTDELEAAIARFVKTGVTPKQIAQLAIQRDQDKTLAYHENTLIAMIQNVYTRFHVRDNDPLQEIANLITSKIEETKLEQLSWFLDAADKMNQSSLANEIAATYFKHKTIGDPQHERRTLGEVNHRVDKHLQMCGEKLKRQISFDSVFYEFITKNKYSEHFLEVCIKADIEEYMQFIFHSDLTFPSHNEIAQALTFGLKSIDSPKITIIAEKFLLALDKAEEQNPLNKFVRQRFQEQEASLKELIERKKSCVQK